MFAAKVDVDPLIAEQKTIASRRQRFEERTKRFLDARARTMGVDTDVLSEQVKEKQLREQHELEREAYFDGEMNRHAEMVKELDNQRKTNEKIRDTELLRYHEQQSYEATLRKQNEQSARFEPVNDVVSVFKLQGDDVSYSARNKAQVIQQQDWLNIQVNERVAREEYEREQEREYEQALEEINMKLARLNALKAEQAADDRKRLQEAHLSQQEEMRLRRDYEKLREQELNNQEIENTMNSSLLNELTKMRTDNAHRPIAAEFKGFNVAQRQAILNEQQAQVVEHSQRRAYEQAQEDAWAHKMESDRRKMIMLQREVDMNAKKELLNLQRTRENQAHLNKTQSDHLNQVVYANEIRDEFFQQFGKSCR